MPALFHGNSLVNRLAHTIEDTSSTSTNLLGTLFSPVMWDHFFVIATLYVDNILF